MRLGLAVTRAREAGGWPRRKDFAAHAGISLRSLVKLESGEEGVGRRVLESVGRALPRWTEDTPYEVLDGSAAPSTDDNSDEPRVASVVILTEEDNRRFELIEQLFRSWGIEMTPRMLEVFHDEIGRQLDARRRRESAPDTERVRSDEDG